MTFFHDRVQENWGEALQRVLELASERKNEAVLAFDLDSTLFDNRPRQARILREFGSASGVDALTRCTPEMWDSGWDMKAAMRNCGVSGVEADSLYPDAKAFWVERFFTSPYCLDDASIPGAAAFVQACVQSGAVVAYVTGRHEGMREGTVGAMKQCGIAPPGNNVHLLMKATLEEDDDAFKREAHQRLGELGQLLAAFDNEPTHVNDYRRRFPEATIIHLATDHSGRLVPLEEGIVSVPHFDWNAQ